MRTEKEMIELITRTALEDPRIRAAYLEGSRANPKVPRDIFQDYDVEYIVEDTRPFREDKQWIDRFGERLYMQYPEECVLYQDADVENWYGWLIQFTDGNRLDLHVGTAERAGKNLELYRVLVDKDGLFVKKEESSDERYWIRRPGEREYLDVCNEFWWCLNNVAKGLWRGEIPYVMDMIDDPVRPMLKRMLLWKIGARSQFSVSAGKAGKYMKEYLPPEVYSRFLATYGSAGEEEVWDRVFAMCDLFQETALEVGESLGYSYNQQEARGSRLFLEYARALPENASEHTLEEWIKKQEY